MLKSPAFFIFIFVCILIGLLSGFLSASYGIDLGAPSFIGFFVIIMLVYIGYYSYIMLLTKNIHTVDKFIRGKAKQPYYGLLLASVEKNYTEAEHHLQKLGARYSQTKLPIQATIQLEAEQFEEAKETIAQIKNADGRHHTLALLALLQGNNEEFEQYKSQLHHKGLQYSLAAEAAYKKGDVEEANRLGELAISSSAGLQKWIFAKSLEHEKANPARKSYF